MAWFRQLRHTAQHAAAWFITKGIGTAAAGGVKWFARTESLISLLLALAVLCTAIILCAQGGNVFVFEARHARPRRRTRPGFAWSSIPPKVSAPIPKASTYPSSSGTPAVFATNTRLKSG